MKLKLFLIFITLAVYTEAFKSTIIKKVSNNIVLDKSSSSPPNTFSTRLGKNVNLMINAFLNGDTKTSLPVGLDTTTSEFWFISKKCQSSFCSGKASSGISDGTTEGNAHGEAVRGTETNIKLQFDKTQDAMDVNVVAADFVSPVYAKSLDPVIYGMFGLGPNTQMLDSLKPSLLASLYIDEDSKNPASIIYFNELPPTLKSDDYATLTYARSTRKDQWRFQIGHIGTFYGQGHNWCNYRCQAVLDINYAGISGPPKDINSLNKYLGADENGYIDCYKKYQLEPLVFHISSRRVLLKPSSFIVKTDDPYSSKCQTVFEPDYKHNNQWTLGYPFVKQRVTVFDYAERQLAFLPLSTN